MIRPILISMGAVYLPALLYFMPPEIIAIPVSQRTNGQLTDIQGSPWHGSANLLSMHSTELEPVHWTFDFSSLLELKPTWKLEAGDQSGHLAISAIDFKTVEWHSKYDPQHWLALEPKYDQLQISWKQTEGCKSLQGVFKAQRASLKGLELPELEGEIRCKENNYHIKLYSPDKHSALQGNLKYNPSQQRYKLELRWRPSAAVRQTAKESGYSLKNGKLELFIEGSTARK